MNGMAHHGKREESDTELHFFFERVDDDVASRGEERNIMSFTVRAFTSFTALIGMVLVTIERSWSGRERS